MKTLTGLALYGALVFLPCFAATARAQVIKVGTLAPEGSPWHDALLELSQKWQEISGGRVRVRIYGGGAAGDEPDMLRKMRIGQLHGAALTTVSLITIVPDIEAISFPTTIRTDGELDRVIEKIGPRIEAQLEKKGFKTMTWTSTGWVRFFANDPIVTPDDLRRQKLFFWGSDTAYVELMKQLGFQPVTLAATDLLPSLQTGLVQAFVAPPVAALSFQWFALAKNMTDMPWQPLPGTLVITTKKWRTVPEDIRPAMEQAAAEVGKKLLKRSRVLEIEAIDAMKKHGLKVHSVPAEVQAEWRNLVKEKALPVFRGPRFSAEIHAEVGKTLKEFRETAGARE